MEFSREWAMPNKNTLRIKPILEFVKRYIVNPLVIVDPFAGNSNIATYTNDLNPNTSAIYHMDSVDFLSKMYQDKVEADLVIFDPPYSLRQTKEVYESIGLKLDQEMTWRSRRWNDEKNIINSILKPDGIFLNFGWNTYGMGKNRGFEIIEIMLVAHGSAHNDTICMAEKRCQQVMF